MVKIEGVKQRVRNDLLCEEIAVAWKVVVVRQSIQPWTGAALCKVLALIGVTGRHRGGRQLTIALPWRFPYAATAISLAQPCPDSEPD